MGVMGLLNVLMYKYHLACSPTAKVLLRRHTTWSYYRYPNSNCKMSEIVLQIIIILNRHVSAFEEENQYYGRLFCHN